MILCQGFLPFTIFIFFYLLIAPISSSDDDEFSSSNPSPTYFEVYLPFRLDFFAEMKLTSVFPRKLMHALKDYKLTKKAGQPVLSMPNCSTGALSLGRVHVSNKLELATMLNIMDDLSRRVFRTGLNEFTTSGNFRLAMRGLVIDQSTRYVYTKFDLNYPTDSHTRYITFLKSLIYRLAKSQLTYEIYTDIKLDELVLGRVELLADVDLKAFHRIFSDFNIGFATFSKILVMPAGSQSEKMRSVFYFDHMSHEPIIGVENSIEVDGEAAKAKAKAEAGTGAKKPTETSKSHGKSDKSKKNKSKSNKAGKRK